MSEYKLSDRIRSGTDIMQRIVGGQRSALIELSDEVAALEQRVEELEKALYEAIEVGGAPESTWVDTDEETKRAWPIPDIDLKEALGALAAEEEA